MQNEQFNKMMTETASLVDIKLSEIECNKFYIFMNLLLEWNKKINLTAIIEEKEIILKHFIDSIIIKKYINNTENILDLGTGAGFPGIPLKIVCIKNNVILVDSLNKRINFLNEVIKQLGMEDIHTIHARAEDLGNNPIYREKYDIVTSRAVARLPILLEYVLPFVKIGGNCICMKGPELEKEIKESSKVLNLLGGEIEKVDKIILPESQIKREILIIKKYKQTPDKYPRKSGIPVKKPII